MRESQKPAQRAKHLSHGRKPVDKGDIYQEGFEENIVLGREKRMRERKGSREATGFVIHEHNGERNGFYLRIEHEGRLLNWALARGVPRKPGMRLPAVRLSDGEPRQALYEGKITRGEYGEGVLGIWDRGRCRVEKYKEARIEVRLRGKRTSGKYSLVCFRQSDPRSWGITRLLEEKAEKPAAPSPSSPSPERRRPDSEKQRRAPVSAERVARPEKKEAVPAAVPPRDASRSWRRILSVLASPLLNVYYDAVNERARRRSLRRRQAKAPAAIREGEDKARKASPARGEHRGHRESQRRKAQTDD